MRPAPGAMDIKVSYTDRGELLQHIERAGLSGKPFFPQGQWFGDIYHILGGALHLAGWDYDGDWDSIDRYSVVPDGTWKMTYDSRRHEYAIQYTYEITITVDWGDRRSE